MSRGEGVHIHVLRDTTDHEGLELYTTNSEPRRIKIKAEKDQHESG